MANQYPEELSSPCVWHLARGPRLGSGPAVFSLGQEALGSRLRGGGRDTVPLTNVLGIIYESLLCLHCPLGTLKGSKAPPVSLERQADIKERRTRRAREQYLPEAQVALTLIRELTTMAPALTMGLWGIPGEAQTTQSLISP